MDSRMDQCQGNDIEVLLEWLGLLRITKEDISNKTIETEYTNKILIALVLVVQNKQTVMLRSIVLDPEWFDGN